MSLFYSYMIDKGGVNSYASHVKAQYHSDKTPPVCVLLTDLSHITISMATGAVAVATASSQSVLQLDVRAVAAWVTI